MSERRQRTGRDELLAALQRNQVRFILIGGAAAEARGWRGRTVDVDIVPQPDRENLDRLAVALNELEARLAVGPVEPEGLPVPHGFDARLLASNLVWNLITPHGPLDLAFRPSGTDGYDDLARHATPARIPGSDRMIPVASSADIIRSKTAASRAKDLAVLPELHADLDPETDR